MRLARGQRPFAHRAHICQALIFFGHVESGDHFDEEVGDVEAGALEITQLIGEEKVQDRAVFVFLSQSSHGFVGNGGARRFGLLGDCRAARVILRLAETTTL